jgi:hypothetical protein
MFLDFTKDTGCRCSGTAFRQARLHLKCGFGQNSGASASSLPMTYRTIVVTPAS